MHYSIYEYRIEIIDHPDYKISSADNVLQFDLFYLDESDFHSSVYGIAIFRNDERLKSALIGASGGSTGIHDTAVVIENDRLLICCSNAIFCLSIPSLELLWRTVADTVTCFEIFKYEDDYIVHGELNISRLDENGNILWQQSGADIFTTVDGKDCFIMMQDFIFARDWENREYKFDYDGHVIE